MTIRLTLPSILAFTVLTKKRQVHSYARSQFYCLSTRRYMDDVSELSKSDVIDYSSKSQFISVINFERISCLDQE